jgi:hypothetical protein
VTDRQSWAAFPATVSIGSGRAADKKVGMADAFFVSDPSP